jgi:hypothetical protein
MFLFDGFQEKGCHIGCYLGDLQTQPLCPILGKRKHASWQDFARLVMVIVSPLNPMKSHHKP